MKVKLLKCFSLYGWYKNRLGEEFKVYNYDKLGSFYRLHYDEFDRVKTSDCQKEFYIKKSDCEIIKNEF